MYKKVSTNLNFVEREKETAQFWKDHDIFKKSIETREGDPAKNPIYRFSRTEAAFSLFYHEILHDKFSSLLLVQLFL